MLVPEPQISHRQLALLGRVLIWQIIISQLGKKFPTCCLIWRFINIFTKAWHCSISWSKLIQSIVFHTVPLRSLIIFSCHLYLSSSNILFLSGFPIKHFTHFSSADIPHTLPMSLPQFDHPNNNWQPTQFHTSLYYKIFKINLFFVPLVSKYRFIILLDICFCSLSITIPIYHDWSPSVLVHSCSSFTTKTKTKKNARKFYFNVL